MQAETTELPAEETSDLGVDSDDTSGNKIRVRSDSSLFHNELEKEEQPMDVDNGFEDHQEGIQNGGSEVADVNDNKSLEAADEESVDDSTAANKAVSICNIYFRLIIGLYC